ncbi:hypothetical protein I7I53_11204 [Histoplasma capsulatum var. duboisii H88]|uniref:Uncharacterized protein n=1 Tax=Ajellomyces capsulatus (strain H88) TaxID=544711 RepID=A0A8A1LCV1_AJEC8|nr:hypothetical protein I7I53_11204 [Histoplasma capsulatum var. duboisii H88]
MAPYNSKKKQGKKRKEKTQETALLGKARYESKSNAAKQAKQAKQRNEQQPSATLRWSRNFDALLQVFGAQQGGTVAYNDA